MNLRAGTFKQLISNIVNNKRKVIIFGAGVIGYVTVPEIFREYNVEQYIEAYVDNDARKWNTYVKLKCKSVCIYPPNNFSNIVDSNTILLMTVSRYSETLEQLEQIECLNHVDCYMIPIMCIDSFKKRENTKLLYKREKVQIPKVIHYMWLGGKPLPDNLKRCLESWERFCPDYMIKQWDESNYDLKKHPYVQHAYEAGAYGFVPDYARLDILYQFGGVYMDTDVEVVQSLDELLFQDAFCGVEKWQTINLGGCSGAIPKHPAIKEMLCKRETIDFYNPDGTYNKNTCGYYDTVTMIEHGYRLNGKNQTILGMNIYPYDYFHPYDYMSGKIDRTENTFCIHHFNGGWLDEKMKDQNTRAMIQFDKIYKQVNTPFVSVIIPIYNVGKYLRQCISSVCEQTYTNIEIILVDDGSTDNSRDICMYYCNIDQRIQLVVKENGGLVSARKVGLSIAKGKYITFVDGDDWIEKDYFETIFSQIDFKQDADIIAYGCIEDYENHSICRFNGVKKGYYTGDRLTQLKRKMLMKDTFFEWGILPHLCDKIIRRELFESQLKNIPDNIEFGEDAACSFPCIYYAKKMYVLENTKYHYRQREGSIVKRYGEIDEKGILDLYNSLNRIFIHDINLRKQLKMYIFFVLMLKGYTKISNEMCLFPFGKVKKNSRILVYGAGGFGRVIRHFISESDIMELSGWADKEAEYYKEKGIDIISPEEIYKKNFDYLVIAILNEKIAEQVKNGLIKSGVREEKIDLVQKEVLEGCSLPTWITN